MDADLLAARMSAAKRQHALHHSQHSQHHWDRMICDDFDTEDDVRSNFSCPYCYDDFDISTLCSHLEDEHLYESRSVVCPVCAVKVGKDLVGHITVQHGHLFKIQRRRRFRRTSIPHGTTLSFLSRELREAHLQVLLGGFRGNSTLASNNVDSLLSALMHNFPITEVEDPVRSNTSGEDNAKKITPSIPRCNARKQITR